MNCSISSGRSVMSDVNPPSTPHQTIVTWLVLIPPWYLALDHLTSLFGHFGLVTSSNPLTMVTSFHFLVIGEGLVGLRAANPTHLAWNKSWQGCFGSIPWYLALGPDNIIFWLFWPRDQLYPSPPPVYGWLCLNLWSLVRDWLV